jgi:hypothetical protein
VREPAPNSFVLHFAVDLVVYPDRTLTRTTTLFNSINLLVCRGDGYVFAPFDFKSILAVNEEVEKA